MRALLLAALLAIALAPAASADASALDADGSACVVDNSAPDVDVVCSESGFAVCLFGGNDWKRNTPHGFLCF